MKVSSPAGDFEITVSDSSIEDNNIVITGQMGVWDSKIYMKPSDLVNFGKVIMKPEILLFLLGSPFRSLFGKKK